MYRFSREGREIAVISLFAAPFARVGAIGPIIWFDESVGNTMTNESANLLV